MNFNINEEAICGHDDLYPEQLTKSICMEECGELTQAISKIQRDRGFDNSVPKWAREVSMTSEHHHNEAEEIADVLLAIAYIMDIDAHTKEDIQGWINFKQSRQMSRDYETFRKKYNLEFEAGDDAEDFIPEEELPYYKMCEKEYFNVNTGDEKETKNSVSNE